MNPRYRSFSGALIAIFAVPVFLGLTACLPTFPVPVGNPEKSSVDPYISGIWMIDGDDSFFIFEPYDKRTWVLSGLDIREDDDYCGEKFAADDSDDADDLSEEELDSIEDAYQALIADMQKYGADCYEADLELGGIKAWRTKLGGEWFMTWEPLGEFDAEDGFGADEWMVFRIDTSVPNQLRLQWLDTSHPAWDPFDDLDDEDIKKRDVERVIRKNAKDKSFYHEDDIWVLRRVEPEHYPLFEDFIENGW